MSIPTAQEFVKVFSKDKQVKNVKFAKVDSGYITGKPRLVFDGETTATVKRYPHLSSYTPTVGDRVMVEHGVIIGNIGEYSELMAHKVAGAADDVHGLLSQGKIIQESGSNANGTYVKYADGTLICFRTITITYTTSAVAYVHYYNGATYTYPHAFSSGTFPNLMLSALASEVIAVAVRGNGTLDYIPRIYTAEPRTSATSNVYMIAIGRWK